MEMQVTEIGEVTKVALAGRLDTMGVGRIETRFTANVVPTGKNAVIDLTEVEFLASLGIRMLIGTARALSQRGGKMALYGCQPVVLDVIETTALDDIIPVAKSEADALDIVTA